MIDQLIQCEKNNWVNTKYVIMFRDHPSLGLVEVFVKDRRETLFVKGTMADLLENLEYM